jgi:hypothetical protein
VYSRIKRPDDQLSSTSMSTKGSLIGLSLLTRTTAPLPRRSTAMRRPLTEGE